MSSHADDLALLRRRPRDPLSQRDVVEVDTLVISLTEAMAQAPVLGIHQQDAERIVVDERAHRFRDLRQQLIQLQDGRELVGECARMREVRFCVQHAPVEPSVVDGRRRRGQQSAAAETLSFSLNAFSARRLNIDDADQFAAREHRHRQFGTHRIERRKIARIASHIVHDHGVA